MRRESAAFVLKLECVCNTDQSSVWNLPLKAARKQKDNTPLVVSSISFKASPEVSDTSTI